MMRVVMTGLRMKISVKFTPKTYRTLRGEPLVSSRLASLVHA
jgi:hypothetical protein